MALMRIKSTDGPDEIGDYMSDAMTIWARQQAVAFAIHYAEAHVNWLINQRKYPDPSIIATDRMDVRYDHFIENQFIEQQNKP